MHHVRTTRFLACTLVYLVCVLLFLLQNHQLMVFYQYLLCVLVIPVSYMGHKFMADNLEPVVDAENQSFLWRYLAYQWPTSLDTHLNR